MIKKKEDNIRSESYYPDSNYYLDQDNAPKETPPSMIITTLVFFYIRRKILLAGKKH